MGWRSIIVSQPAKLSLHNRQLRLEQDGGLEVEVPLEDISIVVLETPQALITTALLAALAEHAIAVLTCDATHHPNGVLLPYLPHSRQTRVLHKQIMLTEPQKKRAWQRIVAQKLTNQAQVLAENQAEGVQLLRRLASKVRSGDPDNLEGQGARCYFANLFGQGFTRTRASEDWINSAMNYGYAIARAALARSLVSHGLLPSLGLFHHSELNAFNLAADLIEPFRAQVDRWVLKISRNEIATACSHDLVAARLLPAHKAALVNLLYEDMAMPTGYMNTLTAIEQCAQSMGQMVEVGDYNQLALPALIPA